MTMRLRFLLSALVVVALPAQADTLSYGCGGGFTGGASGAVIHDDGRMTRWTTERAGSPRVEHDLDRNRGGAIQLFKLLREVKFTDLDFQSPPFNVWCSLTLAAEDGSTHTVSWGNARVPPPPSIESIVEEVRRLVEDPAA